MDARGAELGRKSALSASALDEPCFGACLGRVGDEQPIRSPEMIRNPDFPGFQEHRMSGADVAQERALARLVSGRRADKGPHRRPNLSGDLSRALPGFHAVRWVRMVEARSPSVSPCGEVPATEGSRWTLALIRRWRCMLWGSQGAKASLGAKPTRLNHAMDGVKRGGSQGAACAS